MKFIDMHVDTLMHMRRYPEQNLLKNEVSVDFARMRQGGCLAQFFAIFLPPASRLAQLEPPLSDEVFINELFAIIERDTAASPDIEIARSYADLLENEAAGRMSAFITFEDGRDLLGSMERLKMYYDRGIRLITLTWNGINCLGHPCSDNADEMALGLTDFGRDAVSVMNEMGILVDVSHLSDGGFWDVAQISRRPFVASHSNSRAMTPHRRNLTDEQIKALANSGGCMGINFGPYFLAPIIESNKSTIEDMVRHAKHIVNIGGIEVLALGSDLDGVGGELEIDCISKMPMLFDALAAAGFTPLQIEAIAQGNVRRVIKESIF
ncbi:MAG: dipeptidase [Defluviitaleaceae bacterium]|nr:dipeptidase [Defluviitaleaceae bacterium]